MRRGYMRIVSLTLCLCLLMGMLPGMAPAAAAEEAEPTALSEEFTGDEALSTEPEETESVDDSPLETEETSDATENTVPEETEDETLPENGEEAEPQYPWETMTDDEFADFIRSEGYLPYAGDGDAIESLFVRLEQMEDAQLRDSLAEILLSWLQALLEPDSFIMTLDLGSYGLTLDDINSPDMFFKQEVRGTCTLAANAMLVRRAARLNGYENWEAITESALRPVCWVEGVGMTWNYSYAGIRVAHGTFSGCTLSTVLSFLAQHPEGFVAYNSNIPHAVVITDYTDGVLYCGDPGYPGARVPLVDSYGARGDQEQVIAGFTAYWFVSSPKLTVLPPAPPTEPTEPEQTDALELTATANADRTVTLNWNDIGASGYVVYRSEHEDGPWSAENMLYDTNGSKARDWNDSTAKFLTPYYYCVQGYDKNHTLKTISNVVCAVPDRAAAHIADGTCGSSIRWAVYTDGVLEITGSGNMPDYQSEEQEPWYPYRSAIREAVISNGITSVGRSAFGGCSSLVSVVIPTSVTKVSDWAFRGCTSLAGIGLPYGVQSIGYAAFRQCDSLREIVIPDSVTSIGEWAFSNCTGLVRTQLPKNLTSVPLAAFYEDAALASVNIPDSVKTIGDHAFRGCRALAGVSLPSGLQSIGQYGFAMCSSLSQISMSGGGVLQLNTGAFYNCTSLTTVYLPAVQMGATAFAYCYNLRNLYITQGNTTSVIGDNAFRSDSKLSLVMVSGGSVNPSADAFTGVKTLILVTGSSGADKAVGDSTMCFCRAAGSCGGSVVWYLDAAGTLRIVGSGAVPAYSTVRAPWSSYSASIKALSVDSGITSIGAGAFANLTSLRAVSFAGSAPSIAATAFTGVSAEVSFHDVNGSWKNIANQSYGGILTWLDQHSYSWVVTAEPGIRRAGTLTGTCASCARTQAIEIPALDQINYQYEVKNGEAVYTWKNTDYGTFQFRLSHLSITAHPADQTAGEGQMVSFTVTATGSDLHYRWEAKPAGGVWNSLDASVPGYNTPAIQIPALDSLNGTQFRCRITDGNGTEELSNPAELTVTKNFAIIQQPVSQTAAENETVVFTVAASGGNLSYQWQLKGPEAAASWSDCPAELNGFRSAQLQIPALYAANGYQFRCLVSDSYGNSAISEAAVLHVIKAFMITQQPANQSVAENHTAEFTVAASGEGLTYLWQWKVSASAENWTDCTAVTAGYNTPSLKPEAAISRNGYQYRCMVRDASGAVLYSNPAALTVSAAALQILAHPSDVTAADRTMIEFHVEASGTALRYQWYVREPGRDWVALDRSCTGYNAATLQVMAVNATNGFELSCVVTDAEGNELRSNPAKVTIAGGATITSQPKDFTTVPNTMVTFTVAAAGEGLIYQWQAKAPKGGWFSLDDTCSTGSNTTTVQVYAMAANEGYQLRCLVIDAYGSVVQSQPATLHIDSGLKIVSQPANLTAAAGSTATFRIQASGTGLQYLWQYRSLKSGWITTNSTMPGYNTLALEVPADAALNGFQFRCMVLDAYGTVAVSEPGTLMVP